MRRHPLLGTSSSTGSLNNYNFKGPSVNLIQQYDKENMGIVRNTSSKERRNDRKESSKRKPIFIDN